MIKWSVHIPRGGGLNTLGRRGSAAHSGWHFRDFRAPRTNTVICSGPQNTTKSGFRVIKIAFSLFVRVIFLSFFRLLRTSTMCSGVLYTWYKQCDQYNYLFRCSFSILPCNQLFTYKFGCVFLKKLASVFFLLFSFSKPNFGVTFLRNS